MRRNTTGETEWEFTTTGSLGPGAFLGFEAIS